MNKFKVVATDIDGTLTDTSLRIEPKAIIAIRKLEERGVKFILSSGNALPFLICLKRYIGTSGPVIAGSGGVVYYRNKMYRLGNLEAVAQALTALNESFSGLIEEHFSNRFRVSDLAIKRKVDIEKLRLALEDYPVRVLDSKFAIHLLDKRTDKGKALIKALNLIRVKPEEAVAIGDSLMDLPMFKAVGYSIALANSPIELRKRANYVTRNKFGEGFLEAMKKVFNCC